MSSPAATSAEFPAPDYDLPATLDGGQAFRWRRVEGAWEGVIGRRWVRLTELGGALRAEVAEPVEDWNWLRRYLALDQDLSAVLATFPDDEPMRAAVAACRGLRLLRQEPWECLASFICSSTKQIVQIQEIISLLCARLGEPLPGPGGTVSARSFPTVERVAAAGESELRACKLGFRAPYLLGTARLIAGGALDWSSLPERPTPAVREELLRCPGVGRKIADCALLFGFGRQDAFPVDVWVQRALRGLYFQRARRLTPRRLLHFSETHFGPNAGYAQQYLFHYVRTHLGRGWEPAAGRRSGPGLAPGAGGGSHPGRDAR